ncbi:MAG TPA: hypothetical protein VL137_01880, partial [Polyangiaceae bacterium]|nr:hypothetical protein [Polyangiaceae bacterium]
TSIDDFWVVGGNPLTGPAELAQVQNRQAIAPDLGPLVAQLPKVLFKVTGVGDELVIVGANGTVLWRDAGGAFRLEHAALSDPLFTVSAVNSQNIWAVGGTGQALALHFDGQHWVDKSPADLPNLFGVSATRSETIVGGNLGALAQWQSGKWQVIDTAIEETFHSVWLDGHGGAWAVGGNVLEPNKAAWRGVIWQR